MSTRTDSDRLAPEYEVVVVGAGAAGLNAALTLGGARRRVAVVDSGMPRNAPSAHMHGFLSRDGMDPSVLLEKGRAEVEGYGVHLIEGRVTAVTSGFDVQLADDRTLRAAHVLVATGLRDELPDIPGVRERWGRDVVFCPFCDGYEVRDRTIGVLGTHPASVNQALLLRGWSDDVVYFPDASEPSDEERERLLARGITIEEGTIVGLAMHDDRLRGVELDDRAAPCDVVFLFPRMVPHDDLLTALGCQAEDGWVVTDRAGRTSVPGVWAAGNVIDPRAQVVVAAGMGAAAAFAIAHELADEATERAVEQYRAATV